MSAEPEYTKDDLINFGNFLMEEVNAGIRNPEEGVNEGCVDKWLEDEATPATEKEE